MSQKAPFMPLYVADYLADTGHLSTLEHGAYLLLLMHYWRVGKLPTEDRQLAHVTRTSLRQWQSLRPQIEGFFEPDWTHKRVEKERDNATKKAATRADAGARGGSAKALKNKDAPLANARILPEQKRSEALPSSSDLRPEDKDKSSSSGVVVDKADPTEKPKPQRLAPGEWFDQHFWPSYPSRGTASNPRKPARDKFLLAVRNGADPAELVAAVKRFAEIERLAGRLRTDKVAQAVTWLNQQRWGDYAEPEATPTASTNGRVFVKLDSPQWWAWRDYRKGQGRPAPSHTTSTEHKADGWWFESEWPPGALDAKKAPADEPTPVDGMF